MIRAATFLALAVLALSSCGRTVAPSPGAEELALAKASAETADRENAQLRRRIADLEAEVRRPAAEQSAPARGAAADDGRSAEMAALREEGARYKAGLDKCVAQLNDVSTQPHQTAPARYAPTAPAAQARVYTLSAPEVSMAGDSIEVSGRLWNGGDAAYEGWITIELLLDNRVIDSTRQDTQVGARTDVAYSARFRAPGSNGTYSARVTVE